MPKRYFHTLIFVFSFLLGQEAYADTTAPVISLVGDATVTHALGTTYIDAGATALDDVDGDITSSITVSGTVNTSITGTYTITYSVSDAAGNAAVQITRKVAVSDTTAPVISLVGDATVIHALGTSYTDAGATAIDDVDGDITSSISARGTVDTNIAGTYTITYSVSDTAGNAAIQITRKVAVSDTTAPIINLVGDAAVAHGLGTTYTDAGAIAADDVDGDITSSITARGTVNTNTAGTYTITYSVSDAAGNAATQITRTVTVADTTAPIIIRIGDAAVTHALGTTYADAGATAADDVDGDITSSITTSGTVDTNTAGTYTITYSVSDAAGNAAVQITRKVAVSDTTAPVISLVGDATVAHALGTTYTDAGAIAVDDVGGDITSSITISGTVNTNTAGTYTITYSVSDAAGNAATQITRTVTVADTTVPVISLVGDATVAHALGTTYTDAGATAADDVDGDLTSSIATSGTVNANTAGTYTITYSVSDAAGNAATQIARSVTVGDTTVPISGVILDWKNSNPIAEVRVNIVGDDNGGEIFSAEVTGDLLGQFAFVDTFVGKNYLSFSKTTSNERIRRAIKSSDALAAIKLAVGLNPNSDPDGDGPDEAPPISTYQLIAADINSDGLVNSRDALAILKAAVGLAEIEPRWIFVPEDSVLSFETGIDLSQFESIEVDYPETTKVNMIGILVGDVDGSWEGPAVTDSDGDGFFDFEDAFPEDPSESLDTDMDGIGDNADTDDDGDGVDDGRDPAPLDSSLTPPTAVLTLDINEGPSPLRVTVDASSSIAGFGDDTITSYTWNFGDGGSSTEEATSHIYTQAGSFEIALTVTNSDGLAHTTTQNVNTTQLTDSLVIEGTIFVSSSVAVDSDVNDSGSTPVSNNTRATSQFVTNPVTIGGFANEAGTGPNFDGFSNLTESGDDFDGYLINALGGEIINLRIATRGQGDLDLLLYDSNSELIDFSVSATDNESIALPAGAATYAIVVESFSGFSNYVLSVGQDPAIASLLHATAASDTFIGDLVVKPQNDHQTPSVLAQANRVIGAHISAGASARLYRFGDKITELLAPRIRARMLPGITTLGPTKTELKLATMLAAKQLNRQDDVEYAEPNYRLATKIEPNDVFYERQWHYPKVNLPAAWDKTTGSANVKIAVLDTGVVANHPDLQVRLSADSYDFVSSVSNGGDGDGVDSDGSDPGDGQDNGACSTSSFRSSSFHGTHVAGTIGASTNNNNGTAGITWAGEIMNLRVLGCEGGSTFDIAQALLYAAGIENAFGVSPTKKADVANLSLGGGSPSNVMTDAVQDARAAGLIIIAAAGNDGNATLSYPASYDGVISVAATDLGDQRAFYSQFNARVDIAAPGGDTSADQDADGFPDGVLSTLASLESGTGIDFEYDFYQGTSMATPHVAGIVALMKSVNPSLTPAQLDQLLSNGAMTVDLGPTGRDNDFGHGRIDALLAVEAAQQLADGTIPITDTPVLGVSPSRVSFGATLTERNITLFNAGTGELAISAFTPSSSRISVTPPSNTDGVGAYTLTLDRDGATSGQYMESISIASNGGNVTINVQYEIPGANQEISGSVGELYVFLVNSDTGESMQQQRQSNAGQYDYRFTDVEPGVYYMIAGSDPDNDGFVGGSGEALGLYPNEDNPLLIIANSSFDGLDFNVTYEIPLEAGSITRAEPAKKGIQAACQPLSQARKSLPCILLIGQ